MAQKGMEGAYAELFFKQLGTLWANTLYVFYVEIARVDGEIYECLHKSKENHGYYRHWGTI